ncbi:hypothetical protein RM549_06240 [Salegentibacter sp. F188]|uniref:Phosphatidate cytidylyltransferase n=1 Tax=Autumnicola patrickiae TaxID=3075591 RepID=A0ABU3E070_9FLAO|nr:hypothetical protein [Salegentibacter sp. F188]MDT0689377.1 hypothetical protein [Salegentibacter sp. F188]
MSTSQKPKILQIIENENWKKQLLYGSILAIFFLLLCWFGDVTSFLAVIAVSVIAAGKEHYMHDITGELNYRNFMLLVFPVLIIHIILHW